MTTRNTDSDEQRTLIYKFTTFGEDLAGFLEADGVIHSQRQSTQGAAGAPAGRVDVDGRVFKRTAHDERELGHVTEQGRIRSHGLFEGGELGWVDADGVVVQAGLILGEEEVGRVQGPNPHAAGAALLLLFLPDDAEANRRMNR